MYFGIFTMVLLHSMLKSKCTLMSNVLQTGRKPRYFLIIFWSFGVDNFKIVCYNTFSIEVHFADALLFTSFFQESRRGRSEWLPIFSFFCAIFFLPNSTSCDIIILNPWNWHKFLC